MVQVFQDEVHMADLKTNDDSPYFQNLRQYYVFEFPDAFAQSQKSVIRLIAKDITMCPNNTPGRGINDDLDARVGTISFNKEYFMDVPQNSFGKPFKQNITLFDEVDDDDFDGELNEDDEEMPMIQCIFTVNDKLPLSDAEPAPQKVAAPIASADEPGPSQGYTNPKRVVKSTAAPKPL